MIELKLEDYTITNLFPLDGEDLKKITKKFRFKNNILEAYGFKFRVTNLKPSLVIVNENNLEKILKENFNAEDYKNKTFSFSKVKSLEPEFFKDQIVPFNYGKRGDKLEDQRNYSFILPKELLVKYLDGDYSNVKYYLDSLLENDKNSKKINLSDDAINEYMKKYVIKRDKYKNL